jgi:hypothetical protein
MLGIIFGKSLSLKGVVQTPPTSSPHKHRRFIGPIESGPTINLKGHGYHILSWLISTAEIPNIFSRKIKLSKILV